MSLLSDLVNLNLSDTTKQIIAEYIWFDIPSSLFISHDNSHYLCSYYCYVQRALSFTYFLVSIFYVVGLNTISFTRLRLPCHAAMRLTCTNIKLVYFFSLSSSGFVMFFVCIVNEQDRWIWNGH